MGAEPRYKRILWVDDAPRYPIGMASRTDFFSTQRRLGLGRTIDRITLAHDFKEGVERVEEGEFDLIILDGDFPKELNLGYKEGVEEFVAAYREKRSRRIEFIKGGRGEVLEALFTVLYDIHLEDSTADVVVFSAGMANFTPAVSRGLPFYYKVPTMLNQAKKIIDRRRERHLRTQGAGDPDNINIKLYEALRDRTYVFGGPQELIDKYLLATD